MWPAEVRYRALSGDLFQCLIIPDVTIRVTFTSYSFSTEQRRIELDLDIPPEISQHLHKENIPSLFPPSTNFVAAHFRPQSYLCLMLKTDADVYMENAENYCKAWLGELTTDFKMSVSSRAFRDSQNSMATTKIVTIKTNPKRICK